MCGGTLSLRRRFPWLGCEYSSLVTPEGLYDRSVCWGEIEVPSGVLASDKNEERPRVTRKQRSDYMVLFAFIVFAAVVGATEAVCTVLRLPSFGNRVVSYLKTCCKKLSTID